MSCLHWAWSLAVLLAYSRFGHGSHKREPLGIIGTCCYSKHWRDWDPSRLQEGSLRAAVARILPAASPLLWPIHHCHLHMNSSFPRCNVISDSLPSVSAPVTTLSSLILVILCGAETRSHTRQLASNLDAFDEWCLRHILRISWRPAFLMKTSAYVRTSYLSHTSSVPPALKGN